MPAFRGLEPSASGLHRERRVSLLLQPDKFVIGSWVSDRTQAVGQLGLQPPVTEPLGLVVDRDGRADRGHAPRIPGPPDDGAATWAGGGTVGQRRFLMGGIPLARAFCAATGS